jgi:predicted O-methyltransferase YrrM
MLPDTVHEVYGHVSPAEMQLLYRLASEVPAGGVIVEIGNFQGKSTVCLGLGAKEAGASMFTVDPHEDYYVNDKTHYGMENHAALLKNLIRFDLGETVRVVAMRSVNIARQIAGIDLLWIDGSHKYYDVWFDLNQWSQEMSATGRIAVHDSSGHFPEVSKALREFTLQDEWKAVSLTDATTVLERVHV